MSEFHDPLAPPRRGRGRAALGDAGAVLGLFTVAGLIAAVIWWQVTPLAEFTRTVDNASMDEVQLARQVSADGWFGIIAFGGGLISGVALSAWRKRDALLTVALIALGGGWATVVMIFAGRDLGPSDPGPALSAAAIGDTVPLQLEIQSHALWVVWSVAALMGALGVLWSAESKPDPGALALAEDAGAEGEPWRR